MPSSKSKPLSVSLLGCSNITREITYLARKIRQDEDNPLRLWHAVQNGDIADSEVRISANGNQEEQLEHAHFLFLIKNISIGTYKKVLNEHNKISALAECPERILKLEKLRFITPPGFLLNKDVEERWTNLQKNISEFIIYCTKNGISAAESGLSLSMASLPQDLLALDFKALQQFLDNEMCEQSGWEIKALSWKIFDVMKSEFPFLSQRLGIKCWENRQMFCDQSLHDYNECKFGKGIRPHKTCLKTIRNNRLHFQPADTSVSH